MYEQFFGLSRPPFKITPDTSLFYDGGRRGDVLGALVYAVQRGEGIVKVVGEVGSGKTMLCRMLQQELPDSVEIIYIANPSVSPDDILFVIAHELKLDVQKDSSKHEVMHLLQTHLLKRFSGNRQVVLFVEEAQGMPLETLEEIRLLSNLETDQDKLLQIILFGQPELDDNLKTSSIRQLKERITHEFNLTPLTDEEIYTYLNFRMREVGYTGPELITEKVAKVIGKYSGGLLRRINIIADKVLLSAFAENTHDVQIKHVNAAVQDSGFERSIDGQLTSNNNTLYFLVGLIVILLIWLFVSGKFNQITSGLVNDLSAENVAIKLEPKQEFPLIEKQQVASERVVEKKINQENKSTSDSIEKEAVQTVSSAKKVLIEDTDIKEDRLSEIIIRKKKNSIEEVELKQEKIHKIKEKSISKGSESTKIEESVADIIINNNKKQEFDTQNATNIDWLNWKLEQSKAWLAKQPNKGVSIQVMMRSKSASDELANALRYNWTLDVDKTYLYEVKIKDSSIYRVFYGGYSSLLLGQEELKKLPETVRSNDPYLHSIYKMKKTLL